MTSWIGGAVVSDDALLLVCRLVLAGVFALAAVAKLADREGARRAFVAFGSPDRLAAVAAVGLPIAELAVAGALVPNGSARWGALGALGLLVLFTAGIARVLARGEEPDCHCFGQLRSTPAGRATLVRNGVLAAVAGYVVVAGWSDPGASAADVFADLSGAEAAAVAGGLALVAVLALQGWFSWQLFRQNGRLIARVEDVEARLSAEPSRRVGLEVGANAPPFELPDLEGRPVSLGDLLEPGLPTVLVFSDPGCSACGPLMPVLASVERERRGELTLAVVSRGSVEENLAKLEQATFEPVLLQDEREVMETYLAHGVPSAVLIDPGGVIASPLATGADRVEALLSRAPAVGPRLVLQAAGQGG